MASPQQTEDQPSECPYCGHRHWPGVHTCADCCMNAPPNLKPGRESPSSSESGSSSHPLPDLEDSSSEGEQSDTGIIADYWENHFQENWNQEFLHRQNWLLAEAGYRGRLRDWFRASCQFITESGRLRFDATLQEQEDLEELMDQFDHQAAVTVQIAIIAEERRQNVHPHAGPSGAWGPNDEEVDEKRCDLTHSHLSREQLSKLPSSTSSVDTWVDEVRNKGKGTRCPSCGECPKDCSCRRQISSLEDRVKELKKAAKDKKRDDDSKWKEMEQKLQKLTNLVQNLSTTGLTGPAPTMASHPAPTSSAAPASTPYGVPHSPAPPASTGSHPAFTGNSGIPPTGLTSPIGFNLGTKGGQSPSERSILSVGTVDDIDGEARTTVKERSIAVKKKGKERKESEAKTKEKQKKLKEMRLHQAQSTPFVQPTVDQALLAAAIAQAQAMGGAAVNPVFVNPVGTSTGFNLNHLLNPLHMRLRGSVMKQPKFSGHPNYWASFERQFMVWLQTEKLDKELWILGSMDCLTGKLRESTYNLYVERQNQEDPLTYEELWRSPKKKGSRLPEDHYRNRLENFRAIKKLFLEEIQIARQDSEFLVQEAENSGEGLSEGEMKKILLSKLTPETKQKIRDSQADQKVLGNWVIVRGLPETMAKMAVRELLHSISATGLKDITIREDRWRVGFHDSEQSVFFCSMVDGKVKYKWTVVKVRPCIFSYGVEQIWDRLEKYANLERQKSQDAQGFGGQVSAVGEKGCSVCIALGKEGRAATHTTPDHRWTPSDLKTIQSKMDGKGNSPKNPQQDGARDADQHGRGKGKGQSKGKNRDWTPKDYSQQGGDPSGSRWTDAGEKSGEKSGRGQGKSGNQEDFKVNGNPLYTETPANKTFGNNKDTGGRGKGRSNESNPNSNTSNNKGQGRKKGGGGESFGGRGRGKGVNAVGAGEEWVDEGQVQDVQPNVEEEWQ